MAERWIGVLWAAAAAAILGVLVTAATSGNAPSSVLLIALVVVPVLLTLVLRALRQRSRRQSDAPTFSQEVVYRHVEREPPGARDRREVPDELPLSEIQPQTRITEGGSPIPRSTITFGSTEPLGRGDWQAIGTVCAALDNQQFDWLRTNDYVTPWLDRRARAVIDLAPLLASVVDRPFDWGIRSALLVLSDAIEPFVAYYNDNTVPDPLLLGGEWRFFDRDELTISGETATGDELWHGHAVQLHRRAVDVADAYANLTSVVAADPRFLRALGIPA